MVRHNSNSLLLIDDISNFITPDHMVGECECEVVLTVYEYDCD